jgi:hypothetical protein
VARKRKAVATKKATPDRAMVSPAAKSPLVFISHDSRDAELAEAFANLLTDASGGMLKSFRSSDKRGTAGIEFGADWYSAVMHKLDDATDVVALLTRHSLDRPWILFETGVAIGKMGRKVFGLAVGIPFTEIARGPFAQFQNADSDEDSITKLVLQLIRRHPDAAPRGETVRKQVQAFRDSIATIRADSKPVVQTGEEARDTSIITLFEEIRSLVRDVPVLINRLQEREELGLSSAMTLTRTRAPVPEFISLNALADRVDAFQHIELAHGVGGHVECMLSPVALGRLSKISDDDVGYIINSIGKRLKPTDIGESQINSDGVVMAGMYDVRYKVIARNKIRIEAIQINL